MTDSLTGLRTHRDGLLDQLAASPSVCCLVDIDRLIWVNDQSGHAEGDRVLAAIARYLVNSLDEHARSIFRVGGDEFLVVLGSRDSGLARKVATRIVSGVRALKIPYRRPDRPQGNVIEVNVAILPAGHAFAALAFSESGMAKTREWAGEWIYREKQRSGCDAGVVVDLSTSAPMMTVGELKRALQEVPDEVVVATIAGPASTADATRIQAALPCYLGGPVLYIQPGKGLSDEFAVQSSCEITGRGTVVTVDALADGEVGQRVIVEITGSDGSVVTAPASLELGSWDSGTSFRSLAFLVEARSATIANGVRLRIVDANQPRVAADKAALHR
jgi:diguanylate cyclase (GGDEF)-like protein